MSQSEYRYSRLDAEYDRMIAAQGNARIERKCLNAIPATPTELVEYRCPGCGKDFGSKQARGAHSKYCQKGSSHD